MEAIVMVTTTSFVTGKGIESRVATVLIFTALCSRLFTVSLISKEGRQLLFP